MRKTPLPTAVSLPPHRTDPAPRDRDEGDEPEGSGGAERPIGCPVADYLMRAFSRVVSSVGRSSSFLRPKPKL